MEVEITLPEAVEPQVIVPGPPIHNRFLFVDIAALRAKQLRRGARSRLEAVPSEPGSAHWLDAPHKAERVAMEEVRRGLVQYEVPAIKTPTLEAES